MSDVKYKWIYNNRDRTVAKLGIPCGHVLVRTRPITRQGVAIRKYIQQYKREQS